MKSKTIHKIDSPPGDTIQEHIDFINMSQHELAKKMNLSEEKIYKLLKGEIKLTPEIALKLERVLGIPSNFWSNREKTYRKELLKERN